jgi:hypothetical protein
MGIEAHNSSKNDLIGALGFQVVKVDDHQVLLDEALGPVFLGRFDSPLGIELVDIRIPVLLNVPSRAPGLLQLIDTWGPFTTGQWSFAGDETQGYTLTFGIQMPPQALTRESVSASLEFLRFARGFGEEAMEAVARNPADFPNFAGMKFIGHH